MKRCLISACAFLLASCVGTKVHWDAYALVHIDGPSNGRYTIAYNVDGKVIERKLIKADRVIIEAGQCDSAYVQIPCNGKRPLKITWKRPIYVVFSVYNEQK